MTTVGRSKWHKVNMSAIPEWTAEADPSFLFNNINSITPKTMKLKVNKRVGIKLSKIYIQIKVNQFLEKFIDIFGMTLIPINSL